jgi:hypothetical protein
MKMKKSILIILALGLLALSFTMRLDKPVSILKGSWKSPAGVIIFSESYFSVAFFNIEQKKFMGTIGGKYQLNDGNITLEVEYSYPDKDLVGESETVPCEVKDDKFTYTGSQGTMEFTKIAESDKTPLAALWQITGRENKEGNIVEMPKAA